MLPAFESRQEVLDAAAEAAAQAALNVLRRHRRQFDLGDDDDMARVSGQIGQSSRAVLRSEIEGMDEDDESLCSLPQEEDEDDYDDDEIPRSRPNKRPRPGCAISSQRATMTTTMNSAGCLRRFKYPQPIFL